MGTEGPYKTGLIKRIKKRLPGSWVLKNDAGYLQGVPDLSIFCDDWWGMLEVKRERPTSEDDFEPNQEWYIETFDRMSFAACIYPENEEDILNDMEQAYRNRRVSRVAKRKQE